MISTGNWSRVGASVALVWLCDSLLLHFLTDGIYTTGKFAVRLCSCS